MPLPEGGRAECAAWLRVVLTPGAGPASARDLLAAFGLPEDVLAASTQARAKVVGEPLARAIGASDPQRELAIEASLEWARADEHHLLTLADPCYPPLLLQIGDPPPLLYLVGSPEAMSLPALAIVGSRSATAAGTETAEAFSAALAAEGLAIVSGLAIGIDAAAHRGALQAGGATIALLGTGADRVYPAHNRDLARAIVARGGALVSELALGTGVRRDHFPRRNRLIAGLARGVLVVEAALRSGSLGTARQAGEFGRDVFAIPGSIHSPLSKGCPQRIRLGARRVESAA
ncbi:MAG: DNA-processing protein DprA, partial [Burkholderiaceae bacterium]|nr:DNA-processing protein DprA [Burkholderiaceae bacterium]